MTGRSKINGDCYYERDRHKIGGGSYHYICPTIINYFQDFCVFISPNGRNGEEIKQSGS